MTAGGSFENNGTLINTEKAEFTGNAYAVDAPAMSLFTNKSGASVENHGTFQLSYTCEFFNEGAFDNAGAFTCTSITNAGAFANATTGTVQLNTTLSNEATGTFTNAGNFTTRQALT